MPSRPRLLLVCLEPTSFVRDDAALLSEAYDVRLFRFEGGRRGSGAARAGGMAASCARQSAWLARELPGAALVYGWFADYHLVLPVWLARRMKVPVAVALGGFDANVLPALGYGVYLSRWRGAAARYVMRNASVLLPVSPSLVYHENRFSGFPDTIRNGIRVHVPGLETPVRPVPTGYRADEWPPGPDEREAVVCTVAFVESERAVRLKGVDLLIEAARRLPAVRFEVIGVPDAFAGAIRERHAPPPNVSLLPPRPREALGEAYRRASVYAQLSRSEGLPNVLCEAMCSGCIPVGSRVAGIPEAIGDAGFVVDEPDPARIADALRRALALGPDARRRARSRIVERYSVERRRALLLPIFAALAERRPLPEETPEP